MTLSIRQASNKDSEIWNQYVDQHPNATAYHNFAWLHSIEFSYGHKNISLIAFENNIIVGVLPAVLFKIPLKGKKICCLPYCDVGYLLADSETVSEALIAHVKKNQTQYHAKSIEYRDSFSSGYDKAVAEKNLNGQKVRMLLSLPENSERLLSSFKSKLRSQINKAQKNGLTAQLGHSPQLLDCFYQVFSQNMRKLGSPVHSYSWFEALSQYYKQHLLICIIFYHNTPVGAGIILRQGKKVVIPWASTLSKYNRLAPNMLLYWNLLREATDTGATEFDFGRSTYGEGTFRFKQQWGAQPVPLRWTLPTETLPIEVATSHGHVRKIIEHIWPHLPLGFTTLIGPMFRKYISL